MPRLFAAFVLALVSLLSSSSSAELAAEAQFFDELGRRAYARGKYEEALESFLLVQAIAPSSRALYNIALCAELAGQPEAAFAHYREYLASDDADEARHRDATLRAQRLEENLALVEVASEPAGAAIYVDREELGQHGETPRTIVVPVGERRIVLALAGYEPLALEVSAEKGQVKRLQVGMKPRLGKLALEVVPAFAKVQFFRDNAPVHAGASESQYELPVGGYTVVADAPGFSTARARTVVTEGEVGRLVLGLTPLPKATGRLLVTAGSTAAEVFIDGRRVAATPATLPALEVGEHVVEVGAGRRSARRKIVISRDRATYVEVSLGAERRAR